MQDQYLFEYAVIRVVPRVEREEFLNVGVILFSAKKKFLKSVCRIDEDRLRAFSPQVDLEEVKAHLMSFARICSGGQDAGPIGRLDEASRFRWLTATRSTVIQTSKVHPGLSTNPEETLNRLFAQLVL
ncbi:MAG TPA: DUF3037 domain-containing protein [Sphingobacteriaceae bacterium]